MHVKEPTTLLVKRAGRYPGVMEPHYKKIKMVGAALWLPRASGWPNPHFLSSFEDHKRIQIQIQKKIIRILLFQLFAFGFFFSLF